MTTPRRHADLGVIACEELGAAQYLLRLALPAGDQEAAAFRAGQFAQLAVPGLALPRPFSILRAGLRAGLRARANGAGADSGRATLDFLVKRVGPGTDWLVRRRPGETVSALWPLGHGFVDRLDAAAAAADERWLLVGGGVGIAPLIALWEQADPARPLTALFGYRDQEGAAAGARLHPGRQPLLATEDGSLGRPGRVTELLEETLARATGSARIFCCGPDPMMEAVARLARRRGLPCLISLETLMGCGIGICVGCAVPRAAGGFALACQDGPVFPVDELAGQPEDKA